MLVRVAYCSCVLVFLLCVIHFGCSLLNISINSCNHESEKSTNLKELAGERSRKRQACLVIGGIIIVSAMSFIPYVDWAGEFTFLVFLECVGN